MCHTTGIDMDEISSTFNNKKTGKLIEPRKIRKPLMEKKRRARINQSLDELKRIVVDAEKCSGIDISRANKLEKADILELTVKYLKRNSTVPIVTTTTTTAAGAGVADVYLAGYRRCLGQVRELLAEQWTDEQRGLSGCRMVEHLEACVQRLAIPPPPHRDRLSTCSDEFCHLGSPVATSTVTTATTTDDDDYDEDERRPRVTKAAAPATAPHNTEFRDVTPKATWRPW